MNNLKNNDLIAECGENGEVAVLAGDDQTNGRLVELRRCRPVERLHRQDELEIAPTEQRRRDTDPTGILVQLEEFRAIAADFDVVDIGTTAQLGVDVVSSPKLKKKIAKQEYSKTLFLNILTESL